jgi:hypothetical protein
VNLTHTLELVFLIVFIALILVFAFTSRKRATANLREIPAFARLARSIGLAVEAGRRLHFSLGHGGVENLPGGSVWIGLVMLSRIARAASISDRPPVATSGDGTVGMLSQDTLRGAYRAMRSEHAFNPIYGQVSGISPMSYTAGTIPVIFDQQVSTTMISGHFDGEVALIADANERSNSLTLGGSDSLPAQAVLYASAQEALIGEELYASGAYMNAGITHVASLRAQDILRWVIIAGLIGGSILKLIGVW